MYRYEVVLLHHQSEKYWTCTLGSRHCHNGGNKKMREIQSGRMCTRSISKLNWPKVNKQVLTICLHYSGSVKLLRPLPYKENSFYGKIAKHRVSKTISGHNNVY